MSTKAPRALARGAHSVAEDGGFEPPRVLSQHDFQSCALGHYANPPSGRLPESGRFDEIRGPPDQWVLQGLISRDLGARSIAFLVVVALAAERRLPAHVNGLRRAVVEPTTAEAPFQVDEPSGIH